MGQWWQMSGVIITRDTQRSREGEIRIIDPADSRRKKVKKHAYFGVTGPNTLDSSRKQRKGGKIVQMKDEGRVMGNAGRAASAIATAKPVDACYFWDGLAALSRFELPNLKAEVGYSLEPIYRRSSPKIPARLSGSRLRAAPFATLLPCLLHPSLRFSLKACIITLFPEQFWQLIHGSATSVIAFFACSSAISFPSTPLCPGTHLILTFKTHVFSCIIP